MSQGSGPAGPGPVGGASAGGDGTLDDRLRRRVLWALPTGLYVIGSRSGTRVNLMTANLVVQVAVEPKLVSVALDASSVTAGLVRDGGCFSVSLLSRDDRTVVRRFVKPVAEADVTVAPDGRLATMAGEAVEAHATGAPVLGRAVAWLDCEVRHRLTLGSHDLVIGEVVAVGGPEGDVAEVLRMEDTRMNYGG